MTFVLACGKGNHSTGVDRLIQHELRAKLVKADGPSCCANYQRSRRGDDGWGRIKFVRECARAPRPQLNRKTKKQPQHHPSGKRPHIYMWKPYVSASFFGGGSCERLPHLAFCGSTGTFSLKSAVFRITHPWCIRTDTKPFNDRTWPVGRYMLDALDHVLQRRTFTYGFKELVTRHFCCCSTWAPIG